MTGSGQPQPANQSKSCRRGSASWSAVASRRPRVVACTRGVGSGGFPKTAGTTELRSRSRYPRSARYRRKERTAASLRRTVARASRRCSNGASHHWSAASSSCANSPPSAARNSRTSWAYARRVAAGRPASHSSIVLVSEKFPCTVSLVEQSTGRTYCRNATHFLGGKAGNNAAF